MKILILKIFRGEIKFEKGFEIRRGMEEKEGGRRGFRERKKRTYKYTYAEVLKLKQFGLS